MDDLIALGRYGATSALVTRDGEVVDGAKNILLLFRPAWADHKALRKPDVKVFDLAELWAFVRPGIAAPPTVQGMLGRDPQSAEDSALALYELMTRLLDEAHVTMTRVGPWINWLENASGGWRWPWLDLLENHSVNSDIGDLTDLLKDIPKWTRPPFRPDQGPVQPEAFRPEQSVYHKEISHFLKDNENGSAFLAVGGTGVGKTRAYLSAAHDAGQSPWVSTFTRALQKQVQNEAKTQLGLEAHIRKGRDNYLCLRLLADAWVRSPHMVDGRNRLALATMARWTLDTPDGDLTGGSFPGWLTTLYGGALTLGLADRQKECIYNACPYYANCYAERARAWSSDAPLVVANHAVVAGLTRTGSLPRTLVMDEAHHVEDVMDGAFTEGVSLASAVELRRFLLGRVADGRRRGRRGFLDTLAEGLSEEDRNLVQAVQRAAEMLPDHNAIDRWRAGEPRGPIEDWLYRLEQSILEAVPDADRQTPYDWDADRDIAPEGGDVLKVLEGFAAVIQMLLARMDMIDREASLDQEEPVVDPRREVLQNMGLLRIRFWITQLTQLGRAIPDEFVEWASVLREDGQAKDVGLYRAWLKPLDAWQKIAMNEGTRLVYTTATPGPALEEAMAGSRVVVASPYDYSVQSKIIVLQDVPLNKEEAVASALGQLFAASGGGALAVFTAIARLRRIHKTLGPLCAQENLRLLAQHIDDMDVATLIDLFRTEPRCALMGTDAVRDGVDIPGEALRLLVFDRVPWPRPTLLYRARREAHGGRVYEEALVRLKLRQAFGRLIRSHTDRGVFVLLDSRLPSRLYDAFPPGVVVEKMSLAEALPALSRFFENAGG